MLGAVLAASTSIQALAQPVHAPPPAETQIDQPPPSVPGPDATSPAATVDDASGMATPPDQPTGIEDIVVTATRREERLQRIPVAVTAVTGEKLTATGVINTQMLTQAIPGLYFSRAGAGGQPVIRGVGPTAGSSNGDEPNVATYIDGVYQPDPYATLQELVEIQRIEVLRGPQGTVFGRNATGGLINIITPDPSFDMRGKIALTYGRLRNDADDFDVRAYITGPLFATVAADFAALYLNREGHTRDLVRGGTVGDKEVIDLRGKLMFRPSDRVKIILTGSFTDYESRENITQPLNNQTRGKTFPGFIPTTGPWQASLDVLPTNNYERHLVSLRTSFDLGAVNLETTSAYTYSQVFQQNDSDASNISIAAAGPMPFWTKSYSQEVRLLSQGGGPFNWLLGGYAFHLDSSGLIPVLNANPIPGPLRGPILTPDVSTTSYAAFGEGTYQVAEPLFVTLGARYTYEKRDFVMFANGLPFIAADKFNMDKVTYRGAVRYQANPNTSFYVSYGTGFKSGVYNTVTTTLNRVDPETIKALEGGVKADLSPRLRVNLALYHYWYDDLQTSARSATGVNFVLQNAASSKNYGGELEITAIPVEGLTLSGSAAYTHARYTRFPNAQTFIPLANGGNQAVPGDASGKHMVKAPTLTLNFAPRYEHELGSGTFDISANLFHSSKVYWDFANTVSQPSYTVLNGQIGYTMGNLRFTLSAVNLTNKVYYQQIRIGAQGTDAILANPREVKIGAEFRF